MNEREFDENFTHHFIVALASIYGCTYAEAEQWFGGIRTNLNKATLDLTPRATNPTSIIPVGIVCAKRVELEWALEPCKMKMITIDELSYDAWSLSTRPQFFRLVKTTAQGCDGEQLRNRLY